MPSVLLNNTLSNLSSGVTQQYQEGRFDSQVSEMINCAPSITRGVLRRNPLQKINVLTGLPADLTNFFVYSYDRGTDDEQYIVIIPGDGSIHVYNANDGALKHSSTGHSYLVIPITKVARDSFNAMTIGDQTFIVNSTITTSMTGTTYPVRGWEDMAFYWLKKTTSVTLEQKQTQDTSVTPNVALTGSLIQGYTYTLNGTTITGTQDTRPSVYTDWSPTIYFAVDTIVKYDGKLYRAKAYVPSYTSYLYYVNYSLGNIVAFNNKIYKCTLETPFANILPTDTTYWTEQTQLYPDVNTAQWALEGSTGVNTTKELAELFATNSQYSLATKSLGAFAYNDQFSGTDWIWEDTFGNEASLGVWKTVDNSNDLPVMLPEDLDGFIVSVSGGTTGEYDDYYLKYDYEGKTWREIPKPGATTTIDDSTMPHVLYRMADGTFIFDTFQGVNPTGLSLDGVSKWGARTSGGEDDTQDPSFLGKAITNIFFYKNRFGLITKDSIVLSKTGDYGTFFPTTIQDVLDDDPIDLAIASRDVTVLRHAVSTAGQLFLFSDDTQFILDSLEGPLTPKSADIIALSNYTYGAKAKATAIGNRVFFTNQAGGYSQLYAYRITDQGSRLTEADPMTLHLPTYIDKSAKNIIGHDVLGHTFIETEANPKELVVLSSVTKANKDLQNAFHKWTFEKNIVSTMIINNALYILFSDGTLSTISLEVPGDIDDIVYLDEYDAPTVYDSHIVFSEFFVRDSQGKGTVRGRLQIRTMKYTIEETSRYRTIVESTDQGVLDPEVHFGPSWDDTGVWDDTLKWTDSTLVYSREYVNDEKVTVMANSKRVNILFKSSITEPSKGFELATVNVEAFQHQRSIRK